MITIRACREYALTYVRTFRPLITFNALENIETARSGTPLFICVVVVQFIGLSFLSPYALRPTPYSLFIPGAKRHVFNPLYADVTAADLSRIIMREGVSSVRKCEHDPSASVAPFIGSY